LREKSQARLEPTAPAPKMMMNMDRSLHRGMNSSSSNSKGDATGRNLSGDGGFRNSREWGGCSGRAFCGLPVRRVVQIARNR
jgi:hypothetical protein